MVPRDLSVEAAYGPLPNQPAASERPARGNGAIPADEFTWLIGSICSLLQVSFDALLLRQRVPAPYDRRSVVEALGEFGFECPDRAAGRAMEITAGETVGVAFLGSENGVADSAAPVLVVAASADRIVFFRALSDQPTALTPAEFEAQRDGTLLLVRLKVATPHDPDAVQAQPKFGFRWFIPELLRHKRLWRNVLLASLVIQLLALGTPLITQAIIDKVVVHRTESTLIALGIGLLVFMVFSSVLSWIRQYLVLHTGIRIDAVLGAAVFKHLVELPPRYFQHRPTGVIAARLHGIESIREFLSSAAVSLILDLPFLSICLALMFWYSLPLTLVALGFLALIVVASLIVAPLFQAKLNQEFLLGARNQAYVTEFVAGMETVKSLQMEPILQRRYGDYLANYLKAGFSTKQVANTYNVVAQTLEQGMTIAILLVGAWIVMTPKDASEVFTIGMLVAFQMFAGKLSQPLMRLVGLWQQFQQARLAVVRLGDLMDAPAEPYAIVPNRKITDRSDRPIIEIQHLAFRYADDRPFLYEDLTLSIKPGECIALVGPSGTGKSTLAKLLQGFYLPTRGSILIDGIDLRYLSANELRATFGVVPQETVLFSGAILDNLLLANPQASFDDVVAACRMAEIHDAIEQLPQGYQTEIGERGAGLSGGQKQRIAIARALLKQPRVLIFDEATSNLDRRTAETFATTINRLRGKVAILFITHARFASLKFDRVIELASPSNNEAGPQGTASSSFAPGVYAMRSATGRFASAPGGRPPSANQQAAAGQDK